jgi:hypothetical protein
MQLTPGSEAEACRKEETDTKNKYAKRMGIDGETLSHSQGALGIMLARKMWCTRSYIRVTEEKTRRQDDHDRRRQVDRPVASILQSTTPAEGSIAREVLVILAQLPPDNLF